MNTQIMPQMESIDPSKHARKRMQQRCVRSHQINIALNWGREQYLSSSKRYRYVIGHRECKRALKDGVDISSCYGLVVIVSCEKIDRIITTYWDRKARNHRNKAWNRMWRRG